MRRVRARGVALLLSLLLLALLASLALLAMQATAMEWRITGNERNRVRALAAAEVGLTLGTNTLLRAAAGVLPPDIDPSDVPGIPDDGYRVDFADAGIDADVARDSGGALSAKHFLVHSVGVASGGASADLEADILLVRNAAGIVVRAERSYWRRLDLD